MRKRSYSAVVSPDIEGFGPGAKRHFSDVEKADENTIARLTKDDARRVWPILEKHVAGAINDSPLWELMCHCYVLGLFHGEQIAKTGVDFVA